MPTTPPLPKVGLIHSGKNGRHDKQIKAFKDGLAFFGFIHPTTVDFKHLYADDNSTNLTNHAKTLVNTDKVDVLVAAGGTTSSQKAQAATTTKPIVFTSVADPSRPAANMTGICARTDELDGARLSMLLDLMPGETKFGALFNMRRFNFQIQQDKLNNAAAVLGLPVPNTQSIDPDLGTTDTQIDQAFQFWANNGYKAVLVAADPLFNNHRDKVIDAAKQKKIPAIYQWREFADAGGLMSYGPNLTVAYKLAGTYVGRILKGEKPADLPVLPLNSFELVINFVTADALGLKIPPKLLARVDDIIV